MKENKLLIIPVAVIAVALVIGLFKDPVTVNVPQQKVAVENLGAQVGPDVYDRMYFHAGFAVGGRTATSSTASTYTTQASDFNGCPNYIDWTVNINTTVSLTATSTQNCIPNVGDSWTVNIRNASSTAASTMTLAAADAGLDLQGLKSATTSPIVAGLDWTRIEFIRESTNLVTALVELFEEDD